MLRVCWMTGDLSNASLMTLLVDTGAGVNVSPPPWSAASFLCCRPTRTSGTSLNATTTWQVSSALHSMLLLHPQVGWPRNLAKGLRQTRGWLAIDALQTHLCESIFLLC